MTDLTGSGMRIKTMTAAAEIIRAIESEIKAVSHLGFTKDEMLQRLDDLVTTKLSEMGIDDDEDSICDAFGVDAYHRIRDAQGTFALYP